MSIFTDKFRKRKRSATAAVCILLIASLAVAAWFVLPIRQSRTVGLEINMPPIIYIKDNNLQEITSFNLDGLKIGEEYKTVFCVSPAVPNSVNNFLLGLIYTENLGMEISLYPVYSVTDTVPEDEGALYEEYEVSYEGGGLITNCYFNYKKEKGTGEGSSIDGYDCKTTYGNWENTTPPAAGGSLNNGIYKAYSDITFFSGAGSAGSDLLDKLNDTSQYRFFVLNITWPEENSLNLANTKEADIVYIVSKGTRRSVG